MTAEGHKVASLHGAKDAQERDTIIDNFREGREKVLITTNVIARGIDIMQVRSQARLTDQPPTTEHFYRLTWS